VCSVNCHWSLIEVRAILGGRSGGGGVRRAHTGPDFSGCEFSRLRKPAASETVGVIIRPRQRPVSTAAPGYFVTRLSAANCAHLHRRELHAVHTDASDEAAGDSSRALPLCSDRANRPARARRERERERESFEKLCSSTFVRFAFEYVPAIQV
jgi:hypothetical protein